MGTAGRLLLAALLLAGCSAPAQPAMAEVRVPGIPVTLTADNGSLLVGLRREGQSLVPALVRRAADGTTTEIPVRAASPYGLLATWQSITARDGRYVAVGGERGGAHGNVRWSVWAGTADGMAEQPQAFSTFGGWGAGDQVDAAATPAGTVLVGSWESAQVGLDVAVWTGQGDTWTRQSSAGTTLESKPGALGFATAATGLDQGVLIAGWRLADRIEPVVWRSTPGVWSVTTLPDAGSSATAMAVRCWGRNCLVAGQVDGKLAAWRFDGGWARVGGLPEIQISDKDHLAAPVEVDGGPALVVTNGGRVELVRIGGSTTELRGPSGPVTATAVVSGKLFVVAGGRLWVN
ncbi:hypothetical protein [Alloactinosynnema sp. L-07]|uniref:hypothetical protein n=1 Tax=Alloactinosynnema sp. L-07 TaxID=1653480 RepID=UPI00065EF7DF|nr:hypothetical protein [Alloactinosynnema sp. L-07]CRK59431.1 hypothetical protein [Alloactinosynnema sp. L-07]